MFGSIARISSVSTARITRTAAFASSTFAFGTATRAAPGGNRVALSRPSNDHAGVERLERHEHAREHLDRVAALGVDLDARCPPRQAVTRRRRRARPWSRVGRRVGRTVSSAPPAHPTVSTPSSSESRLISVRLGASRLQRLRARETGLLVHREEQLRRAVLERGGPP